MPGLGRGAALRALVLLSGLLFAGCQTLLGDFTLVENGHGCSSGEARCVGNVLQTCDTRRTGWDNAAVCASETLCDATKGVCLPPTCAADERHCQEAELQVCKATRDGWSRLDTCATAGLCSTASGTCTDEPCEPGEIQCNGKVVQACRSDRSGWDEMDTCDSPALCNKARGECDGATCQQGQLECDGAELRKCNEMLDGWDPVQRCDSETLCDAEAGTCKTASCSTPGVFRCDESGALERCDDDLAGWGAVDACPTAAHCDAVNGQCTPEPCMPGVRQCNGPMLQVCNAERTAWDLVATCETDGLCQATLVAGNATCMAPACKPTDTQCVDGQPQVCNAGRTGFRDNGAACVTVELCNAGRGTCGTPVCEPNQTTCNGAQPQICNAGRTALEAHGEACASAALCNPTTGTCGDQQCVPGQLRCDPDAPTHLQQCNTELTGWEEAPCDVCETAELCSASLGATTCDENACREPVCDAAVPHCGGSGTEAGRVLEICNAGRTGYTPCQTCVTPELCTASLATTPFACAANACTAPSCSPSDRWCGGTGNLSLYQCPPSRINTQAMVIATCVTSGLCELTHQNGETTCEQPTCALSDRWCGGSGNRSLYQCPSSRINSEATVLDTCATSGLCELTHQNGKTTCEAPACTGNATRCGGTGNRTLQMCKSDQTGFSDCDTCSTAALCTDSLGATTCNSSACHACTADEARCNTEGNYETCNSARTGFDVADCQGNGCSEASGGCLMPGTGGTAGAGGSGGMGAAAGGGGTGG